MIFKYIFGLKNHVLIIARAVRMKICILRYPHSARIFRFSMNPVWLLLFKAVTC